MFIGIIGSRFAGKHAVAKWLVSEHGFTLVSLWDDGHVVKNTVLFEKPEELLLHVTKNWRSNFVTCNVETSEILEIYRKRPFFLLLAMDGPVTIRYARYKYRCQELDHPEKTLEEFVREDDKRLFKLDKNEQEISRHSVYSLMIQADLTIINSYSTLPKLYSRLKKLDITNSERLRPSWESYFMYLSDLAALRSNCMKRRVGCILVKDHRVVATGYNGTPRGLKNCNEGGCDRCNDAVSCGTKLENCLCLHAEENALLEAGRSRIDEGCILYCNTCPCLGCAIKLIQVGVKEVVYKKSYNEDKVTHKLFEDAGVKLRKHLPPNRKLCKVNGNGLTS